MTERQNQEKNLKVIKKPIDNDFVKSGDGKNNNPPNFKVQFFKDQKNLDNISCYSNEGGIWKKSKINLNNFELSIDFREPFVPRRGRINCSLNDNGKWRWFGTQFTIRPD